MVQDGATGGGKKKKNRNKNKKNKQQQQQDEANSQPELEQQTTSETLEVSQSATKQHGGKFVQTIFKICLKHYLRISNLLFKVLLIEF